MRHKTTALAVWLSLALCGHALAKVYELPRSTAAMPVQALITCESAECEVAEHCARYDEWANISSDADFSKVWTLERNQAAMTPKRANGNLLCAMSVRKGKTYTRPLRYYRTKNEAGSWTYMAMTRDWGLREMSLQSTVMAAPATDYDFYQLVKSKRLCFDGCGDSADYIYFKATVLFAGSLSAFGSTFTHFSPGEGTLKGEWEYEQASPEFKGSLTLNYYDADGNYGASCWFTLEFEDADSGTYEATCDDEDIPDADGPWIVTGR